MTGVLDPENNQISRVNEALEVRKKKVAETETRIQNFSLEPFKRQNSLQLKAGLHRNSSNRLDSLQMAEDQFIKKKLSHVEASLQTEPQSGPIPPQSRHSPQVEMKQVAGLRKEMSQLSRGSSTPSLFFHDFDFKNTRGTGLAMSGIKQKQAKPFNIISGME